MFVAPLLVDCLASDVLTGSGYYLHHNLRATLFGCLIPQALQNVIFTSQGQCVAVEV